MTEWSDTDYANVLRDAFRERDVNPELYARLVAGAENRSRALAAFAESVAGIKAQLEAFNAGLSSYSDEWRVNAGKAMRLFEAEISRLKRVHRSEVRAEAAANRAINEQQALSGKARRAENNRRVAAEAQHMRELVYELTTRLVARGGVIADLALYPGTDGVATTLPDWMDIRRAR